MCMCICHVRMVHKSNQFFWYMRIVFGFLIMSLALCFDVCLVILDYCWLKNLCNDICILGSFLGSNLYFI